MFIATLDPVITKPIDVTEQFEVWKVVVWVYLIVVYNGSAGLGFHLFTIWRSKYYTSSALQCTTVSTKYYTSMSFKI